MAEVQYYPDWFDPNEIWLAQGQAKAPVFTLIENKIFVTSHVRADVDPDDAIGRGGVTAIKTTNADANHQLNWIDNKVFQNEGVSGPYTNLTDSMVDHAADQPALTKDFMDEMAEGEYGIPYSDGRYTRFWSRIKARLAAASPAIPYVHFGTYGTFANIQGDVWQNMTGDGSHKAPNDQVFKNLLQSQTAARKKPNGDNWDYYSLFYGMGMGSNVKHYADQPDYASKYFNKGYAIDVQNLGFGGTRGIGHPKIVVVDWYKVEGLGGDSGDLHNGFYYERQVGSLGKVRTMEHPQVDFDWHWGNIFTNGFVRSGGYVLFDVPILYGTDPTKISNKWPYEWIPNQPGTAPPVQDIGYPAEPKRGHDAGYIAAHCYQQCNRTSGLPWQDCEYKIAGTDTWITPPSDHSAILEHASANAGPYAATGRRGRMDAKFRLNESTGALDVWGFDPSRGKDTVENVIFRPMAGVEIAASVKGSKLHLRNETV